MKKSYINPKSDKQREKDKLWGEITDEKAQELDYICQWCGRVGHMSHPWGFYTLDGHHIIPRRYNQNNKGNCFLCHRICHSFITDNNVDVERYPTKESWEVNHE